MTILTVKIEKDKDLLALKEEITRLGLKYEIEPGDEPLLYTDEFKNMLDKRHSDCLGGMEMVSAEESNQKIEAIFANCW